MGVERTPNNSKLIKLTLERKILLQLLLGLELATFRSLVQRSTNELSRLPGYGLWSLAKGIDDRSMVLNRETENGGSNNVRGYGNTIRPSRPH